MYDITFRIYKIENFILELFVSFLTNNKHLKRFTSFSYLKLSFSICFSIDKFDNFNFMKEKYTILITFTFFLI